MSPCQIEIQDKFAGALKVKLDAKPEGARTVKGKSASTVEGALVIQLPNELALAIEVADQGALKVKIEGQGKGACTIPFEREFADPIAIQAEFKVASALKV
jgi:hypothetical protein